MSIQSIEELQNLLARDVRIDCQKRVNTLASFQEVDESLNRDTRACKARRSMHDIFVDGDHSPQRRSLLSGHNSTLSR
jgi:hypothetical protein